MSHTPGPWVNDSSHSEWGKNVVWAGDVVIAHVVDDQHDNADANARLIAAAPELLAALKMAVRVMQDNDIDESMAGEFEIWTDAIAKAEGRGE